MEGKSPTQEAYENIREHFSQPDAVLGKSNSGCFYRGDGDPQSPIRCAFGVLIRDDLYKPEMENKHAAAVLRLFPHLAKEFPVVSKAFIMDAQGAHDARATDPKDFVRLLDSLALEHNLTVPA